MPENDFPCPTSPYSRHDVLPSDHLGQVPVGLNRGEVPVALHRGGQPGNLNGLKHGFYSKQLKGENLQGLDPSPHTGLTDDIVILRVYIRRLLDLSQQPASLDEMLSSMRVLCIAYLALTRLVKTQHLLTGGENPLLDDLRQAIDAVHLELTTSPV